MLTQVNDHLEDSTMPLFDEQIYYAQYVYNAVVEFVYFVISHVQNSGSKPATEIEKHLKFFKEEVYEFACSFSGIDLSEKCARMLCTSTPAFYFENGMLYLTKESRNFKIIIFEEFVISKTSDLILRGHNHIQDICDNLNINDFLNLNTTTLISLLKCYPYFYIDQESVLLIKYHGLTVFHIYHKVIQYFLSLMQNVSVVIYHNIKFHTRFIPSFTNCTCLVTFCVLFCSNIFKCKNGQVKVKNKIKINLPKHNIINKLRTKLPLTSNSITLLVKQAFGTKLYNWNGEIFHLMKNGGLIYCVVDLKDGNQDMFVVYFNKSALKYLSDIKNVTDYLSVKDKVIFNAKYHEGYAGRYWQADKVTISNSHMKQKSSKCFINIKKHMKNATSLLNFKPMSRTSLNITCCFQIKPNESSNTIRKEISIPHDYNEHKFTKDLLNFFLDIEVNNLGNSSNNLNVKTSNNHSDYRSIKNQSVDSQLCDIINNSTTDFTKLETNLVTHNSTKLDTNLESHNSSKLETNSESQDFTKLETNFESHNSASSNNLIEQSSTNHCDSQSIRNHFDSQLCENITNFITDFTELETNLESYNSPKLDTILKNHNSSKLETNSESHDFTKLETNFESHNASSSNNLIEQTSSNHNNYQRIKNHINNQLHENINNFSTDFSKLEKNLEIYNSTKLDTSLESNNSIKLDTNMENHNSSELETNSESHDFTKLDTNFESHNASSSNNLIALTSNNHNDYQSVKNMDNQLCENINNFGTDFPKLETNLETHNSTKLYTNLDNYSELETNFKSPNFTKLVTNLESHKFSKLEMNFENNSPLETSSQSHDPTKLDIDLESNNSSKQEMNVENHSIKLDLNLESHNFSKLKINLESPNFTELNTDLDNCRSAMKTKSENHNFSNKNLNDSVSLNVIQEQNISETKCTKEKIVNTIFINYDYFFGEIALVTTNGGIISCLNGKNPDVYFFKESLFSFKELNGNKQLSKHDKVIVISPSSHENSYAVGILVYLLCPREKLLIQKEHLSANNFVSTIFSYELMSKNLLCNCKLNQALISCNIFKPHYKQTTEIKVNCLNTVMNLRKNFNFNDKTMNALVNLLTKIQKSVVVNTVSNSTTYNSSATLSNFLLKGIKRQSYVKISRNRNIKRHDKHLSENTIIMPLKNFDNFTSQIKSACDLDKLKIAENKSKVLHLCKSKSETCLITSLNKDSELSNSCSSLISYASCESQISSGEEYLSCESLSDFLDGNAHPCNETIQTSFSNSTPNVPETLSFTTSISDTVYRRQKLKPFDLKTHREKYVKKDKSLHFKCCPVFKRLHRKKTKASIFNSAKPCDHHITLPSNETAHIKSITKAYLILHLRKNQCILPFPVKSIPKNVLSFLKVNTRVNITYIPTTPINLSHILSLEIDFTL